MCCTYIMVRQVVGLLTRGHKNCTYSGRDDNPLFDQDDELALMATLQSRTGPVQGQNRVFPAKFFSQEKNLFALQGTPFLVAGTLFSLQGFPCEKNFTGKTLFSLQGMGLQCTDTKIIPFFQKLEEKSVDFRSLLNKGSKIRKARHKSSIRMRVNIDFL